MEISGILKTLVVQSEQLSIYFTFFIIYFFILTLFIQKYKVQKTKKFYIKKWFLGLDISANSIFQYMLYNKSIIKFILLTLFFSFDVFD